MDNYTDEQIERFIQNEMSADERESFCAVIKKDPELKRKVELRYLLIEAGLCAAEEKARKAMIAPVRYKKRYIVATIISAACVLGFLFVMGHSYQYSPTDIYHTEYTKPFIEQSRGGSKLDSTDVAINREILEYARREDFEAVVTVFKQKWRNKNITTLPITTLLYISMGYLETGNSSAAISLLTSIDNIEYEEEIKWLLLGAYLKENEREKAKQEAMSIISDQGIYTDSAIEILNRLNSRRWF